MLNIRRRLAKFIYPLDLTDLIREKFKGISKVDFYGNMDENDKRAFEEQSMQLHKNKALNLILDELVASQIEYLAKEAQTMQEVSFGRATINGLELLREKIAQLNAEYEQHLKRTQVFDKYDVVGF
jgi:hypothetical protein